MKPLLACCTAFALLAGCAAQPNRPGDAVACSAALEPGVGTRLAMVRQVLDDGQPYAALAHLEALNYKGEHAALLRADILRRIGGGTEAAALYRGLLSGCLAGLGHHGLGLLASAEGRAGEGIEHFRQARALLPANARVRNDLGYALLVSGALDDARHELLTAQDLAPSDRKVAFNLVLLYYVMGDTARAEDWGRRHQASPETLAQLKALAVRLAANKGEQP
ncbi:tetratricopeptide repeat protein [Thauera sp.]|jgi:Flp pilus assembly protein TadD|uniref:tetratricopeptide repeat protein n=1 Tax=Thauera sp. TaxID=1905334 RepID=UPI002A362157|nr:tetratricopeptide repeat protein [Thauera sp.]MDX9884870.1 tetratricopeptide repeat protein [Thauera sp.]